MQCLIAAWVFVLGSCFGSFLNVVIYRLPAGMSLGKPKSRCPQCETPLAAKDNIPVFGWLLLRGKCRYCGLPIPARYPLIETTCGLIFLVLLFCELLTGAENLPLRHPDHFHVHPGFWLVWFAKWDLSGLYLYHCSLLIMVLATCMIGYDQHRPQRKLGWFGIGAALAFGMVWSELRPVPAYPYPERISQIATGFHWTDSLINPGAEYWTAIRLVGFIDGVAGVVAGAFIGRLLTWQSRALQPIAGLHTQLSAVRAGFLLVGAFLGWQACGMIGLLVLLTIGIFTMMSRPGTGRAGGTPVAPMFFVALAAFLLFWQELNDASWMIGYNGWKFTSLDWRLDWLLAAAGLTVFSAMVRYFTVDSSDMTLPPASEPVS
ncbi:MAG: prepilin peptidase [Fuerstiella sp.]|nr:prepilin peptidase [Fuerstiella sp.]MCP4788013.1 prepilin peptidase [Fuerstiella sp.]MCP4855996.1 prepilin peptidase [Fuerstiella sp.]